MNILCNSEDGSAIRISNAFFVGIFECSESSWKFLVSPTCHVNVKLVRKYPPYHCVLSEDNEVTWCPVLNINKTRSIAVEDSYSIL